MTIYVLILLLNVTLTVYGLATGQYHMVAVNGIAAVVMVALVVYSERKN